MGSLVLETFIACFLSFSYDPLAREWTTVASMANKRIAAGLVVINRFLYAVGGSNGEVRLSSMEKYFPEENRWISCPPMSIARSGAGKLLTHYYIIVDWYNVIIMTELQSPFRYCHFGIMNISRT